MRALRFLLAAFALAAAVPAAAEEAFKVVVHPDAAVDALSKEQLSDVFLKRATSLPGGVAAHPVDQADGSKVFDAFCQSVHGKPGSVVRAFWKRVGASGRDSAPPTRASDEEVLAYVRANHGAIGYVSPGAATAGVKVVKVN
jgi:ABC-type phosphate transport system substrate-binding protein